MSNWDPAVGDMVNVGGREQMVVGFMRNPSSGRLEVVVTDTTGMCLLVPSKRLVPNTDPWDDEDVPPGGRRTLSRLLRR